MKENDQLLTIESCTHWFAITVWSSGVDQYAVAVIDHWPGPMKLSVLPVLKHQHCRAEQSMTPRFSEMSNTALEWSNWLPCDPPNTIHPSVEYHPIDYQHQLGWSSNSITSHSCLIRYAARLPPFCGQRIAMSWTSTLASVSSLELNSRFRIFIQIGTHSLNYTQWVVWSEDQIHAWKFRMNGCDMWYRTSSNFVRLYGDGQQY